MIERAATCLENGGRHLLRLPKKSFRKHRSLHSAFWSHGAGDINLPAWWLAFLRVPSTGAQLWGPREDASPVSSALSDSLGLGFLDFLYPRRTLAFIRRCVTENTTALRQRRQSRIPLQRSRAYTSTADISVGAQVVQGNAIHNPSTRVATEEGTSLQEEVHEQEARLKAKLHGLLHGKDQSSKTREMWQVYQEMQKLSVPIDPRDRAQLLNFLSTSSGTFEFGALAREAELKATLNSLLYGKAQPPKTRQMWQLYQEMRRLLVPMDPGDLTQLFKCLSMSSGTFELERTKDLLHDVPKCQRQAIHYTCAISAALKQHDLNSAMTLHRVAASQFQGSFGSSLLFKYAVEHSKWKAALRVWKLWQNTQRKFTLQSNDADFWDGWDSLPIFRQMRKALEALNFACNRGETSGSIDVADAEFAKNLVTRALNVHKTDFSCTLQEKLLNRVQTLVQKLGSSDFAFVRAAILQSFSVPRERRSTHSAWGMRLYHRARDSVDFAPDLEILDAVLKRAYDVGSWQDINILLEDYRKHRMAIPQLSQRRLILGFAERGDFDMAQQLLREGVDAFGKADMPFYARTLLTACYRRAKVGRATEIFESLQATYGYAPDIHAWNILLATYSRVSDRDGAMALFDKLVTAKLSPDGSTYGILMGMFAKSSDYDATRMLFEQAISEAVEPSIEMVDSLVLAQVTDDRLDEAEQTIDDALQMDFASKPRQAPHLSGDCSRTRMWNTVLGRYAMTGQLDKVSVLQKRMYNAKVAFDGVTYASLITAFCVRNKHEVAVKILSEVMPKAQIRPTELHYAILMGHFVSRNNYRAVFNLGSIC